MSKVNIHLNIIRIIACLLVIFMHAPLPNEHANGLFLSTLSYITAPCIGLFFMVSGSLLLPIKTDAISFIKKRLSKVVAPTLFWSAFYIIANIIKGDEVPLMKEWISILFSAQGNPVLWFMYTLIGLYLLAPILSRWLQAATQKELELYLGIWGISLCYPILAPFVEINTSNTGILYYFTGYAGYFVLGYYLKQYPQRLSWKVLLPVLLVSIVAPVWCKIMQWQVNFYEVFWYLSIFVVIQCICCYIFITQYKREPKKEVIRKGITQISNLSFGIYLIHIFIMRYLLWEWSFIQSIDSYVLQTVVIGVLTFVISTISCYFISLLPFAKYLIGYQTKKA